MDINEMSEKLNIRLPENLDVIIYIHKTKGFVAPYVAHALQYNISADGESPKQALDSLIKLIIVHCEESLKRDFSPSNRSDQLLWDAYGLGDSISEHDYAKVKVRLAQGVEFQITTEVRRVCNIQKKQDNLDFES